MYNKAQRIKYRIYFLGTQRYQKHPIIRPDRLPNARTLHMLAHIRTVYTKPFRSGKRNWTNCVRIVCFFQLIPYFLLWETTKTFTSQNCWTNCPTVECFYPICCLSVLLKTMVSKNARNRSVHLYWNDFQHWRTEFHRFSTVNFNKLKLWPNQPCQDNFAHNTHISRTKTTFQTFFFRNSH